ncbi:hypothetical protein [Synechococcus sp. PCC 7502]|uniref:hypothetical protein n=1 Tax=Synechococcus sp. PCC 7502 TaxID=1173263 RepID=UPI000314C355|nr:hypothetical protein [Synechococcus sp. PCC 7502]
MYISYLYLQRLFYHIDTQIGNEIFTRVDTEIIKLLIDSGSDILFDSEINGLKQKTIFSGLTYALYSKNLSPEEVISLLLDSIPNIEDRNY